MKKIIYKICLTCGKKFTGDQIKRSKYCSKICAAKANPQCQKGAKHKPETIQKFKNRRWGPDRKTGRNVECFICKTVFYRKKSHLDKIQIVYCSEKCRIEGLKLNGSWSKGLTSILDERVRNNHIKIHQSCKRLPNKPETKLNNILQENFPNEWKYVGDGKFIIGGYNPDFVNINNKKQVIEMFGDYWHKGQDPNVRINLFKQYGYSCLIIWERELKDILKVKELILNFI